MWFANPIENLLCRNNLDNNKLKLLYDLAFQELRQKTNFEDYFFTSTIT